MYKEIAIHSRLIFKISLLDNYGPRNQRGCEACASDLHT